MLVKDKTPRYRDFAHHGRDAGLDFAHLSDHRHVDRRGGRAWSAFCWGWRSPRISTRSACCSIELLHTNLFPAELYFLSRLPSIVEPREVTVVVGMTLTLAFLASIYPAWKAASLDPVRGPAERVTHERSRARTCRRLAPLPRRRRAARHSRRGRFLAGCPVRPWRSSRPRARANQRCCISPACWSAPTPARSRSTTRRPRR